MTAEGNFAITTPCGYGPGRKPGPMQHKDGRKLCIEMTFALVKDEGGAVLGSAAMARDVTERVMRERGKT